MSHSFGELKLPSSQTTLVRVVAVKRESELSVSLIGAGFPFSAFLLLNSCPVDCLANAKDVAVYLECLCILELDVYTVDFAAARVVDFSVGPLLAFGVVFQTLYKDSYFGFYLVVFDGCACGKSITV